MTLFVVVQIIVFLQIYPLPLRNKISYLRYGGKFDGFSKSGKGLLSFGAKWRASLKES